jgi:hypothetical protein
MRTRAGWIALVLTGGLALAPATLRAQGELDIPGREEAPTVPLPLSSRRPEDGGFYTALEFAMFRQPREFKSQNLAYRGGVDFDGSIQADLGGSFQIVGTTVQFVPGPAGPPGAFIGSGTPALNVNQLNSQWTYQPGTRFTAGWRFSDGSSFEVRWLHLNAAVYSASADIVPRGSAVGPQLLDTWLFSPVYNFTSSFAGELQELGVGNIGAGYGIWNFAQAESIKYTQRYDQGDFWGKVPVREDAISRTYIVAGARFAWIWENFQWRTESHDSAGQSGPQDVAIYSNTVSNRMYGTVIGCQHDVYLGSIPRIGAFALQFHSDFAPMIDIVKERAEYSRADRMASTKKSVTEYTFSPELNGELTLAWYPVRGVQVKFSWDSMMFLNTVTNDRPVSFNFGTLGATNDFGPEPLADRQSDSIWQRKAIRYFDGVSFGVAISF